MKLLVAMSVLIWAPLAQANQRVTKDTDIGKREVTSHYQVTRCEPGKDCVVNSVTRFDKEVEEKKNFHGECSWAEVKNLRVKQCTRKEGVKKAAVKKEVKPVKLNRIQLHVGYGSKGLDTNSNNNSTDIKEERGVIGGLQYTRAFSNDTNVGVSVFTNSSATISFGLDY